MGYNFPQPRNIGKLLLKGNVESQGVYMVLPFKANASYQGKWWRMSSRCWNACFGNCSKKLQHVLPEQPERMWSTDVRGIRHMEARQEEPREYKYREDSWAKRSNFGAPLTTNSSSMSASVLGCTHKLIAAVYPTYPFLYLHYLSYNYFCQYVNQEPLPD